MDLDECRDPETGVIAPWALEIIGLLESYSEVSPSQTGVHVFCLGVLPGEKGINRVVNGHKIEIYDHDRFFTFTGDVLPGSPSTVEGRQEEVSSLYHWVKARTESKEDSRTPQADPTPKGGCRDRGLSVSRSAPYVCKSCG